MDGTEEDTIKTYETIRRELSAYGNGLDEKGEVIAITKADIVDEQEILEKKTRLEAHTGREVSIISAVRQDGMRPLLGKLFEISANDRVPAPEEPTTSWAPLSG